MKLPALTELIEVEIILATFNGEKFLAQQLDSVLSQTHTKWKLLISDDGSTDSTLEIAARYAALDKRISVVNSSGQGGVVANFGKALSFASADYLMFCDQDDVWLNDKISLMLDNLLDLEARHGKDVPILGFSDLSVVDYDLTEISESFYVANRLNPSHNLDPRYLMWSSTVYGCSVIFNAALYRIATPVPAGVPMHDQWFALLASKHGLVFHVPAQTLMYRQHGGNVVGARPKTMLQRLLSVSRTIRVVANDTGKCRKQIRSASRATANLNLGGGKQDSCGYELDRIGGRIAFVMKCVLPFWKERAPYALLFSILFVLRKNEK
jgi:glycosyltransferase involved in cell wall biosynthesis